jgi:hypothetical protein
MTSVVFGPTKSQLMAWGCQRGLGEEQKSRKAEKQASEQGGESWSQSVLVQDEAV